RTSPLATVGGWRTKRRSAGGAIRNKPLSRRSASGRLRRDASSPAPKVSNTADTPLKMASDWMARRRKKDGWIMVVLLLRVDGGAINASIAEAGFGIDAAGEPGT